MPEPRASRGARTLAAAVSSQVRSTVGLRSARRAGGVVPLIEYTPYHVPVRLRSHVPATGRDPALFLFLFSIDSSTPATGWLGRPRRQTAATCWLRSSRAWRTSLCRGSTILDLGLGPRAQAKDKKPRNQDLSCSHLASLPGKIKKIHNLSISVPSRLAPAPPSLCALPLPFPKPSSLRATKISATRCRGQH